jgi:hypothetical protein
MACTDGKNCHRLNRLPVRQLSLVALSNHADDQLHFHQRKVVPDAKMRAAPKGEIGSVLPWSRMVGRESLGIKRLWLFPIRRMTVNHTNIIPGEMTGWNAISANSFVNLRVSYVSP